MTTDWPRIATWIWKQTANVNLRQQTDDNDKRLWKNDILRLDFQLPNNDKNRLDQKQIKTDSDSVHMTKDNSKRHDKNEEQLFDNRHKDKIYFEEEWNQLLLKQKSQENKIHLELNHPHDSTRDQRQKTNKKPAHLRLKQKLNQVIALLIILSLFPGATSRCITLPENIINEKGRTAKVKFSTVDCSIQKISIPLSNQESTAGLLPLKFKVYEYGTKPGEEPTTNALDKTTNKPGKENEFPPDKVTTAQSEKEVIDKPVGEILIKPELQEEEAVIAPPKSTTDESLDDSDGKLLPQLDQHEEGSPLNKPDTNNIINPEAKPEKLVTPKLDANEDGTEPIDNSETEDIIKPGAQPSKKPEEAAASPNLDPNKDTNEEINLPEMNLDTEEIEPLGNKPISETSESLDIGAENELIETIVKEVTSKVTKKPTKDLTKDESFLESDVSLGIGADEEVFDNVQGNILPITQKTVKTDVANKDEIKSPVTKSNTENVNANDFIPDETNTDLPKQFDGEEMGKTGKQTTKQTKAIKATNVTIQMDGGKTTAPKNGNDKKRTDTQIIENDTTKSSIFSKSFDKLGVTDILLMPTGEEQIIENALLTGNIGRASTESDELETKRQTIKPSVDERVTASTGEQVTEENSTKYSNEVKISMMTHKEKQITESTSLRAETYTTSNNNENKETISSFVTDSQRATMQHILSTEIQYKDTLETMNENLHQITKMETSKDLTNLLSDQTISNGMATTIDMIGEETTTNKLFSKNNELPTESEDGTSSITSNIHPLKGSTSETSMEPNIHSTSSQNLSKKNISTSSKMGEQTAEYEHSEGLESTTSSLTQTNNLTVTFSNKGKETTPIKPLQEDQTGGHLVMNGETPTIEIKVITTAMINGNYNESNLTTMYDKRTSNPVGLDSSVLPTNHDQPGSTTTKEKGENDTEDKLTISNSKEKITEIGTSSGNLNSSVNQNKAIVTTMKIKDDRQTTFNSTTTLSEISIDGKKSLSPKNQTKMVDDILFTILGYSEQSDVSATNKYGQEILGKETSNGDKNNNSLTSKITNNMPVHMRTSKTSKPTNNTKITKTETKLTTPVNKNKMTQKEQSGLNIETIEDPSKGITEMKRTTNTENNDYVTKISQTKDSSENESESTEKDDMVLKKTSLKQGSTRKEELRQTTELTKEHLLKLIEPSTIEGLNPNHPEHTKGNIGITGETASIDVNTGKTLEQKDKTDKLTETTTDSGTHHVDKHVETTDNTEDKMKTTKETDGNDTSANQPTESLELLVSPEESEGQITQLNSNSYFTAAQSIVLQTKNIEYSTTDQQQVTRVNTYSDKHTEISTSVTSGPKTKTFNARETTTTTKGHPSEQKDDTMGLTNTIGQESVTPKQTSSTKVIKLISENGQTVKSKHSTTGVNMETLDIGNDAKTFGIDQDPTSTSTLTIPCVCPTASTSSSSTQSTTPGILTTSGSCFCPDITSSMAEEETSTNMPEAKGRRRRRKEIEEMDLYVDNFDQKIMKKMPFLKFY